MGCVYGWWDGISCREVSSGEERGDVESGDIKTLPAEPRPSLDADTELMLGLSCAVLIRDVLIQDALRNLLPVTQKRARALKMTLPRNLKGQLRIG